MSFVDTNVVVNAPNPSATDHRRARGAVDRLRRDGPIAISRQIMREFLAVISRPQRWGGNVSTCLAVKAANGLARTFLVLDGRPLAWAQMMRSCGLHSFGGKQVHDANIVATMLAHGRARLLTFNAKRFRRFVPLIEIIEP